MQTKILFFILIFSLLFFSPCLPLGTALFAASLTDANLRDGIGVRALGMGGAFTAVADDPTAVFYNPAGLVSTSRFRLERGYLDSNSQVYKNNDYTIFTYGAFAVSTWLRTTLTGESAAVSAVSYGRDGGNGIWWGFSYKNLTGNLPNSKTTGSSFDLGLLGTFPNNLSWGILFQDLLDNVGLGGGVRLGLSYQLFSTLTLAGDMEYRNLKSSAGPQVFGHVGVEQQVTRGLVLRGGYDKDRWTAGGSLSFRPVELHYALQMSRGNGEQATQLVGVKIEL